MPEDNTGNAPIIPAGTEPTVHGTASFMGQAQPVPNAQPVVETPQATPQEAPQAVGTTFEELAAKKGFKSADDLARSYTELEKKQTNESMSQSDLLAVKNQAQSPTEMVKTIQESNPDMGQDEAVRIVQGMIDKSVAPIKEQLAIKDTFKSDQDMTLAPQVAELVRQNPNIPWDVALDAVKQRSSSNEVFVEQGKQEAQQLQQTKQAVQTDSGHQAMKPTGQLNQMVGDKSIPLSEIAAMIREQAAQ